MPSANFSLIRPGQIHKGGNWVFAHPLSLPNADIQMDLGGRGDRGLAFEIFFAFFDGNVPLRSDGFDAEKLLKRANFAKADREAKAAGYMELF